MAYEVVEGRPIIQFCKKRGKRQYQIRSEVGQAPVVIVSGWDHPKFENFDPPEMSESGLVSRRQRFSMVSDEWQAAFNDFLSDLTKLQGVELLADFRNLAPEGQMLLGTRLTKDSEDKNNIEVQSRFWRGRSLSEPTYPDEVQEEGEYIEGSVRKVTVNAYERDRGARSRCIAHYGPNCTVCRFDFGQSYGEVGEGFIHVHHLVPVSEIGREYHVDPIRDLRPVCPNCHAMLHKRSPPYSVEEMRELMQASSKW